MKISNLKKKLTKMKNNNVKSDPKVKKILGKMKKNLKKVCKKIN